MCSDCPNAKKLDVGANFGLLSQILGVLTPVTMPAHSQRCQACGLTWADFQKTQLFGCPACYENHAANLAQLLPRLQPGTEHSGKIPAGFQNVHAREMIEVAKAKLPQAIAEENYELAAKLRDEIKALEKILGEEPADETPA